MKAKLLAKKGFTLVECVIAIAILTIFSLLILMIISISLDQYKKNRIIDDEVNKQALDNLAVNDSYDDTHKAADKFYMDFEGAKIEMDYQKKGGDESADLELKYFVGNIDDAIPSSSDSESSSDDEGVPGAIKSSTRIYGSKGIVKIEFTITSIGANRYQMVVKINDSNHTGNDKFYRQLKISFKKAIKNFTVTNYNGRNVRCLNGTNIDISDTKEGINNAQVTFEFDSDEVINYDYFGTNIYGAYTEIAGKPGIYGVMK